MQLFFSVLLILTSYYSSANERSSDSIQHFERVNKAFIASVRNMSEEEKLQKILDLQREVRSYRQHLKEVEGELELGKINHEVFLGIQKVSFWASVVSLIHIHYAANTKWGIYNRSLWSLYPKWARTLFKAPVFILLINWLVKKHAEGKIWSQLELKAEMDLRLEELEDRLFIIEKLLRGNTEKLLEKQGDVP